MEDKLGSRAVKLIAEVDYLIYMDKDLKVLGYEMSQDDCQAFTIRYGTEEDCGLKSVVPKDTAYTLDVFGVHTTLVFLLNADRNKGELLTYKPTQLSLAKEAGDNIESVVKYPPDKEQSPEVRHNVKDCVGYKYGFCQVNHGIACVGNQCKDWEDASPKDQPIAIEERLADILTKVPYPNWMEECWGTRAWLAIWKNKPFLQTMMLDFSAKKYKDTQERANNEQDKSSS